MARIQAAIEGYKAKLGHYPPDAVQTANNRAPQVTLNQLYYELVGTVASGGSKPNYTTLDGSSTIGFNALNANFNVTGLVNSTRGASSDETPPAENFLPSLRPGQTAVVPDPTAPTSPSRIKILIGYPWKKLPALPNVDPQFTVDPIPVKGAEGVNPWRYRAHTDDQHRLLNNPDSYDLWLDVNIGGTVYRICNWSQQPLKVTRSLDK
jgi:hypothetical protein